MKKLLVALILATLALPACSATGVSRTALPAEALVIRGGQLIDGTGNAPIANGLVAMLGDKIIAVGPASQFDAPLGAQVIEVEGCSILPGVIDAHVHIEGAGALMERWLQQGVTTVCDLGANLEGIVSVRKNLYEARGNHVPTIIVAGPIVTAPGGYPVPVWGNNIALQVADAEAARQGVNALLDGDADIIKIAITGENVTPTPWPMLSAEQVQAITQAAHQRGARVIAHVDSEANALVAIENGVDCLAHLPVGPLSDETIAAIVARDTCIIPTVAVRIEGAKKRGANADDIDWLTKNQMWNLGRFVKAGGQVAVGSDYGNTGIKGGMPFQDMEWMLEAGMTPMQVLVAATRHAAAACNVDDRVGVLAPGKLADVIVVQGDPLQDIHAMNDVSVVVKNGQVVK